MLTGWALDLIAQDWPAANSQLLAIQLTVEKMEMVNTLVWITLQAAVRGLALLPVVVRLEVEEEMIALTLPPLHRQLAEMG